MPSYEAVYKCRLCGKEFKPQNPWADNPTMADKETYKKTNGKIKVLKFTVHFCENGEVGFGDLLGCRKVE